jgi:hypothetical protein
MSNVLRHFTFSPEGRGKEILAQRYHAMLVRDEQSLSEPLPTRCPIVAHEPEAKISRRRPDRAAARPRITDKISHVSAMLPFDDAHSAVLGARRWCFGSGT